MATANVTSHLAGIGAGNGKMKIGSSGQYQANASATPRMAPEAPITMRTGTTSIIR